MSSAAYNEATYALDSFNEEPMQPPVAGSGGTTGAGGGVDIFGRLPATEDPRANYRPTLHGACLSFPFRPDRRGTLAVVSDRRAIIEQSIASIIETRQGERVMLPDYGIPDFVFAVMDAGFAARVAYLLEQQIKNYEPLVGDVKVTVDSPTSQQAAIRIAYTERGSNTPCNMVYPVWELRAEVRT